jgi:lipoprotein-anchoring transpeptidase ErfK/SrfK
VARVTDLDSSSADRATDGAAGRTRRLPLITAAAVTVVVAAVLVAVLASGGRPAATRAAGAPTTTPTTTTVPAPTTTIAPLPQAPPGSSLVATLTGPAPASVHPGDPPVGTVPATWYGYPSVLPVLDETPGWALVRLAQRPNGSTAWVPMADLTFSSTPYRIVIDLATERLELLRSGTTVASVPAGIGSPDDPTPTGNYFMTMKVPAPSPGYGPFVLVTSAHSNTITDWEGSGDAIIAIHGPIDDSADAAIGTTGSAISHGCVRLHDQDLATLVGVPAGTPVDIVAG